MSKLKGFGFNTKPLPSKVIAGAWCRLSDDGKWIIAAKKDTSRIEETDLLGLQLVAGETLRWKAEA